MNSFFTPPVPLNLTLPRLDFNSERPNRANEELKRLLTVKPEPIQPEMTPDHGSPQNFPSETVRCSVPYSMIENDHMDLQATLAAITFQQTLMAQQFVSGFGGLSTLPPLSVSPTGSDPTQNVLTKALASTTSRRSRSEKKPIPDEMKDSKYFERRKRNNLAAKKSRDARKMREDQVKKLVAIRAGFLEHENSVLRTQVSTLREEAMSLRQLWIQKKNNIMKRDLD